MPLPDFKPEPTRFDKSVESVLNGRNAAMFVNIECKKRMWELEFEEVDQVGPVHDRTFTYSLTVGARNSEDVIVTCGIAKGKKDAKRRCCEAMVLKLSDLPPPPPMPMHFMNNRFMRFNGRGGRFMRGGRFRGGFGPRMPPPESEETVLKKYDKTPRGDHPSKNHPISKLSEYVRKNGWPVPQWDLINEKIIQQRKNKHGNANIMLYTYKITIYPGKGQVEPRVYFGSGPTKKDAKFACGSVAWSNLEGGLEPSVDAKAQADASKAEAAAGGANISGAPTLDPATQDYNPMQMAANAISDLNQRKRTGVHKKEDWLESVDKNLKLENKLKKFMELPADLRPPTQLIKRTIKEEKVEVKKEEGGEGEGKEERKRKRKSRWETAEEPEIKKEVVNEDDEKPYQSRSNSREKESGSPGKERERSKSRSRNSSRRSGERDRESSSRRDDRDDRGSSSRSGREVDMWRHDKYDEVDADGRGRGRDRGRRDRDREGRSGGYDDYRYHDRY